VQVNLEDGGSSFLQKNSNFLPDYGIISQKTAIFKFTTVIFILTTTFTKQWKFQYEQIARKGRDVTKFHIPLWSNMATSNRNYNGGDEQ
jgi:hypothetical protein